MSRNVSIATVQAPAPVEGSTPESIQNRGLELLHEAAKSGADIICLPEYINCMACPASESSERTGREAKNLLDQTAQCSAEHQCYTIASVLIDTGQGRFNRSVVFDRSGNKTGHYDKVHLTNVEQDQWGVSPGKDWPVFECDFGKIAIMTCYDGCFPEPPRILALRGAEIIFWPSLQRTFTQTQLILQTQAHAHFNFVTVVRSSYGTEKDRVWKPGTMVGQSCICGPDGNLLASLGTQVGWTKASIDLDAPELGERSFGGEVGILRDMRMADRRPGMYEVLG